MAPPDKKLIVVIGMHRSGTSLCANVLHEMGADMGTPAFNAGPANARGHWERPELVRINDLIFSYFNRGWGALSHILTMPDQWLADHRVQALRHQAAEWIARHRDSARSFGFKDPRTTLLMPFWRQVMADLGVAWRIVFCVRDPAQVTRSLARRDGMATGQAEYRWLVYNRDAIEAIGGERVCIVPYENWFSDPGRLANRLARHCELPPLSPPRVQAVVAAELRHDAQGIDPPSALAARLHRKICWNTARTTLDLELRAFAGTLGEFAAHTQPLLIDMEILRTQLGEHQRVVGDLQALVARQRAKLSGTAPAA